MKDVRLLNLIKQLEVQINNNNLDDINKFEYTYFVFLIKSKMDNELQKDFLGFLKEQKDIISPYDIANFFLSKNIKFNINFKYVNKAGIKNNIDMLKIVLDIKKQMIKINHSIKFYKKKFANHNKDFTQLGLFIKLTRTPVTLVMG